LPCILSSLCQSGEQKPKRILTPIFKELLAAYSRHSQTSEKEGLKGKRKGTRKKGKRNHFILREEGGWKVI
jgi:hypothetical protein